MFGKAGLGGLMKQAQQMQENMKKAQAKLAETSLGGYSGIASDLMSYASRFM